MNYQAHIVQMPVSALRESNVALVRNAAALIEGAIRLISYSGACIPVLVEGDGTIIGGEEYWRAYCDLGFDTIPAIVIDQLDKAKTRALRLAFRRIGQMAVFSEEVLASELSHILLTPDLIGMTPFSMAEGDQNMACAALLAAIPDRGDAPAKRRRGDGTTCRAKGGEEVEIARFDLTDFE